MLTSAEAFSALHPLALRCIEGDTEALQRWTDRAEDVLELATEEARSRGAQYGRDAEYTKVWEEVVGLQTFILAAHGVFY